MAKICSLGSSRNDDDDDHPKEGDHGPQMRKMNWSQELEERSSLRAPESKLDLIVSLSEIELALLIVAARLEIIVDADACNFNMAYDEYLSLASRAKIQASSSSSSINTTNSSPIIDRTGRTSITTVTYLGFRIWSKEIALVAWEKLGRYGLLVPVSTSYGGGRRCGGSGGGREDIIGGGGGPAGRFWRVDVALDEIVPALNSAVAAAARSSHITGPTSSRDGGGGERVGGISAVMAQWCQTI